MTLVPAVMVLLGRRAWALPRRPEQIVPDVDIEGERRAEGLSASASAPAS
jgi:RND superfamily putative drug exporter